MGSGPTALALDSAAQLLFVANRNDASVDIVNTTTNTVVGSIWIGGILVALAIDPSTHLLYVVDSGSATLYAINEMSHSVVATIDTGNGASAVAVNSVTHVVDVANSFDNTVSVIHNNAVVATINVGTSPTALAVDSARNELYVANASSASLSVIDGASNSLIHTFAVSRNPQALDVDTRNNLAYVTTSLGILSVVDLETGVTLRTMTLGGNLTGVSVNPARASLAIAKFGSAQLWLATASVLPASVRNLSVRWSGSTALLSWAAPAIGLTPVHYLVTATTTTGHLLTRSISGTKTSLAIHGLSRATTRMIAVTPLNTVGAGQADELIVHAH